MFDVGQRDLHAALKPVQGFAQARDLAISHQRALMKHDLPLVVGTPPYGRTPAQPLSLAQGVSQQVERRAKLGAMEVAGFPGVFRGLGQPLIENLQYVFPTVATTGGTDLPECFRSHPLEIQPCAAKFGSMKDRFTLAQRFKDAMQSGVGRELGFHGASPY